MKRKTLRRALGAALALVALVSGAVVAGDLLRSHREREAYASLASQVRELAKLETPASSESPPKEEELSGRLEAYRELSRENPDLAGWIAIPGTEVDYPVLYTPEDPEYYLRRDFYGEYAVSGSIFVGEGCQPGGSHTILYGHNMDDGSMFAALLSYQEEDFAKEHSTARYDTLEEEGEYQLVGAFYSKAYSSGEEGAFRYYQYTDLSDPQAFQEYVEKVEAASLYSTGVKPQPGDRLLTLSTCSYHTGEGRFVVVFRRV